MNALVVLALLLAAGPAILFMRNLRVFRPPAHQTDSADEVSILIPARNEARNIRSAVEVALLNRGAEVLVLDDASTDDTAKIVSEMAVDQPRLRLLRSEALPNGWFGKNWACAQLAKAATRPWLLFVDADVRLAPDAAAIISHWMRENGVELASGLPKQELGSFAERLMIPLIHFVLLGFLPIRRMRQSRHPAYATGCGQLVMAEAKAYRANGGHGSVRDRIHDGLALPKIFREQGFRTDLFDGTNLASCRMYRSGSEMWRGLTKNTHEGLGAPPRIVPATIILLAGQVLPFVLLLIAARLTEFQLVCLLAAGGFALLPRIGAAFRFRQPLVLTVLHPVAVTLLLAIQWIGLVRFLAHRPAEWKSRKYFCGVGTGEISGLTAKPRFSGVE